jgi:ankyrin repeat protein
MESLMAALMPPLQLQPQPRPQPQRYWEADIFKACFQDRHEELEKSLLQLDLDLDWTLHDFGITAAYVTASRGYRKCLSTLISHGADISRASKNGWAPIHVASLGGRYACLALLLAKRRDLVNLPVADEYQMTPAMICSQNDMVKCLALLLDKGADLSLTDNNGYNAVHHACLNGQWKSLVLLIKRGANINKQSNKGQTPLDLARMYDHSSCIMLLTEQNAVGWNVGGDLAPVSKAEKVCLHHRLNCYHSLSSPYFYFYPPSFRSGTK